MTWTEASGTDWMAVLIMGVLGYIKQKELLWRNADQRRLRALRCETENSD